MYSEIILDPEKQWRIVLLMAFIFATLGYVLPRLL